MPTPKLPAFFIGHGSPMNGIEENDFSLSWRHLGEKLGAEFPAPKAVLCVSAHWLTRGTHVTAMEQPPTIHDFGGFPQALFDVRYPAPGSLECAHEVRDLVPSAQIGLDQEWGLDHGAWTVIRHLYPEANIPVLQLSIDYAQPGRHHYELGRQLAGLRRLGYLVIGSGNMVHNLRRIDLSNLETPGFGFDWAHEMNTAFKQHILDRDHGPLMDYETLGPSAKLAIPTPDHYYPLLYVAVSIFNDVAVGGSLTMTSVRIG
jgi:4,5-DOPA dioxygenase extradiol